MLVRMTKLDYRDWMAKPRNGGLSSKDADLDFERKLLTLPKQLIDEKHGQKRILVN